VDEILLQRTVLAVQGFKKTTLHFISHFYIRTPVPLLRGVVDRLPVILQGRILASFTEILRHNHFRILTENSLFGA
jgi:hypothetical protein